MIRINYKPHQQGVTLVELMIALIVGLILIASVLQIFVRNNQTYRMTDASSRVQEKARFAFSFLTKETRAAGYYGCAGQATSITNTLNKSPDFLYDFGAAIEGFEATSSSAWAPTIDTSIKSPLGGSDILVIRGIFDNGIAITGQPSNSGACYAGNGSLFKISTKVFFIRNNTAGVPSLYLVENSNTPEKLDPKELVEGISNMQITYGEGSGANNLVTSFSTANNVSDWASVISIRISLLMTSTEDNITENTGPASYSLNGPNISITSDRKLRRDFTTTIAIRNRLR